MLQFKRILRNRRCQKRCRKNWCVPIYYKKESNRETFAIFNSSCGLSKYIFLLLLHQEIPVSVWLWGQKQHLQIITTPLIPVFITWLLWYKHLWAAFWDALLLNFTHLACWLLFPVPEVSCVMAVLAGILNISVDVFTWEQLFVQIGSVYRQDVLEGEQSVF